MISQEFEGLRKAAEDALANVVRQYAIAVEGLTEAQVVKVFKDAISCGDIRRLVRVDNQAQTLVYIPFEREQELELKIEEMKKVLRWMEDRGGLGAQVHDEIRRVLAL